MNVWKQRQQALQKDRPFEPSKYPVLFGLPPQRARDRHLLSELLRRLNGYLYVKPLMLHPDDDLYEVLGLDQDELCEIIAEVTAALGWPRPLRSVRLPAIHTVGELHNVIAGLQ